MTNVGIILAAYFGLAGIYLLKTGDIDGMLAVMIPIAATIILSELLQPDK